MKKLLFVLFLVLVTPVFGQNATQKKLLEDVYSIAQYMEQKDYDKILDLTHPKVFEYVKRDQMKVFFSSLLEGDKELKIRLNKVEKKDFEVSEIFQTQEGAEYAFVTHPTDMDMVLVNKKIGEEEKQMYIMVFEMKGMEAKFINDNTINIKKLGLSIAIKDDSTNNTWRYANHDEGNPLYVKILPVEIIKKAKDYMFEKTLKEKEKAKK